MRLPSRLACLLIVTVALPAHASDLVDAPEITTASIQPDSGWYARIDAAHSLGNGSKGARVLDPAGDAGGGYLSESDDFSGGAGIGYRFNDILRTDVTARYGRYDVGGAADMDAFCGVGCRLDMAGRRDVVDLDANLYADLGTIMGVTPYVGAGVGASHISYEAVAAGLCAGDACTGATDIAERDGWRASYSLMAGAAYALSGTISLDAGYRYTHTGGGDAFEAGFSGRDLLVQDKGTDRHLVTLGLRFRLP
ncbi:outer membrane beta-barrel protein [Aureimonas altamirensis]|uniref:outer membrane protein n=1 Tax=Aureimonas altamirensis TaxID=370622 RepID=UPI002036A286|nr:outer membrane beta-barrel protein [Aureimonas altamirensis]MCM2504482.1 outer membrane beta-barrel protein [Aureimonas altamirensis]